MSTHRNTWKQRERDAAAHFGTTRKPGSGSQGRPDETRSDSKHLDLYIECKLRAKCATRTLYDDVKVRAAKEGKVPVLMLAVKQRPGFIVCVHSDDLRRFAEIALQEEGSDGLSGPGE